jgi:macrolide transport system ATP-binding/permease protein
MIELRDIYKTYQMGKVEVRALQGISLRIMPGEFAAIMGPSGSGKSTLMHILGLLDRPDRGEYLLSGHNVTNLREEERANLRNREMGFIFQQFHLLARMTALENAQLPLIYAGKGRDRGAAKEKVIEVGLADRISHRPNELSGGQQQRVAIARALVNNPQVILADEPTGNLDSASKEEILAVLKRLNDEGRTVIVVTHENEVANHARRVIAMRDGKIISDKRAAAAGPAPEKAQRAVAGQEAWGIQRKVDRAELKDFIQQALFVMLGHKMRSFLSILGILIGVAAVIAMLSLGYGAQEAIKQQLASLGSNLLVVRPGSSRMHGVAMETGAVTRLNFSDVAVISRLSGLVKSASPSVSGRAQLVYGSTNWNSQVEGVGTEYERLRNASPAAGRFFSEEELRMRGKVALLGPTVARELFAENSPVGETVKINQANFKVIGVLPSKGAAGFHDQDDTVVIPVTTAMYRLLGKDYLDTIYVEAEPAADMQEVQDTIQQLIIQTHRLTKDREDTFQIWNMADIRKTLEATTKTMAALLGSIAAISLLVGGIGIMNIMLVSVTERTREIGLRKAIGATNRDILAQFLVEAMLMSFIGGALGILLGCGIAALITFFAGWAVKIAPFSILLATVFSVAVGLVFGLWPARQAALLDPIEALRYE